MKNFFICLTFIASIFSFTPLHASIRNAAEPAPALKPVTPEQRQKNFERLYKEIPNLNDADTLKAYLKKRLEIATPANIDPGEVTTPSSTNVTDPEKFKENQEAALSAYEKIYKESLEQAKDMNTTLNEDVALDGTFYRIKDNTPQDSRYVPDFPYVTIKLSESREIIAPAEEHIAYLLSNIKIEPTGLLKVTEEFVFVSNNEGFPHGFFRILPKYSYSRNGERRRLDFTLRSVTVNGEEYPYKVTEIGNHLHIEPKTPLDLPTGIYTYRFSYIIDRAVWFYDDFDELYWDITAKTLKNVVGSANAAVILPTGKTFLSQNAIASTKEGLKPSRVTITSLTDSSLGFADTEALAVGDDIHLFITLEKGTLLAPDFNKKYLWFIHDFGAELFALLALFAIFASYKVSLAQIRRNQDKTKAKIKKTPAIFRLINKNIYDKTSLGAEILNLCAKNILELNQKNNETLLIKKTDNLKKLAKPEQKLVNTLFPGTETVLPASPESCLKLARAYNFLRYQAYKQFHIYKLKLNIMYLAFSFGMLILGIAAAAAISFNPAHTFGVILCFTLLFFPCLTLFFAPVKKRFISLALKAAALSSSLSAAAMIAIYTSNFYAVLMALSAYLIIYYYRLFSRRSGLLRNKIKETEEYKSYLQKNPELNVSARDFVTKIPYIYAFEIDNKYKSIPEFILINNLLKELSLKTKD